MILTELKDYVIAHPQCSASELAKQFALSEDGIDAMLAAWVKRGKLKITVSESRGRVEKRYLWVDDQLGITVLS